MKPGHALVLSTALCLLASGCSKRQGATVTAFGEGTGRSVPEFVKYFEDAGKDFDQHLKSANFSITNKPANAGESGFSFVAQRDTWYERTGRNAGAIHVKVRQPTENAAGLHVYVVWHAEGTPAHVVSVQKEADGLRVQLTEWWDEYKRKKPMGAAGGR